MQRAVMITQHGLQRSGTNALRVLVQANLPEWAVIDDHHKHQPPTPGKSRYLVSVKDPITWALSYWRWRARKALDEDPPRHYDQLPHQLDQWLPMWSRLTADWLALKQDHQVSVVQHEQLLRASTGGPPLVDLLTRVFNELHLPYPDAWANPLTDGYATREATIDTTRTLDTAHHLEGGWAQGVNPVVMARLQAHTMAHFATFPAHRHHFDLTHLGDHVSAAEATWQQRFGLTPHLHHHAEPI